MRLLNDRITELHKEKPCTLKRMQGFRVFMVWNSCQVGTVFQHCFSRNHHLRKGIDGFALRVSNDVPIDTQSHPVEKETSESTSTIVYGEKIRFGVIERHRHVKPVPKANGSSAYSYNPIRREPTGMLSIEVWNYYSGGPQKVWRDCASAKLEEQLPKSVAGMMRIALKERADERARQERELARQKRIDEVEAELEKIQAEEKKIKILRKDVAAWHRAERIRNYVAAVRESGLRDADWIAWAERQADRLDPLKETAESIVDGKEEVLRRLHSAQWEW